MFLFGYQGEIMIVVRTRKSEIIIGVLIVVAGWAFKASWLLRWVNQNQISVISFLLLLGVVISLSVGAISVMRGKRSSRAFILHIVFAILACVSTHFLFVIPLALGALVAIGALIRPVLTQQDEASQQAAKSA
jgi:hypothetical protein